MTTLVETTLPFEEGCSAACIVRTASPIRKWYLTRIRGLHVRAVRCTPVLVPMVGFIVYARSWVLVA